MDNRTIPWDVDIFTLYLDWTFYAEMFMRIAVLPGISTVGVVTNCLGIVVLMKSGFKEKPSTCLLLGLAMADFSACVSEILTTSKFWYFRRRLPQGHFVWELPYVWAMVCHSVERVTHAVNQTAIRVSTSITMFITAERLVALFLPMHFPRIVTRLRVCIAMVAATVFWMPWPIIQLLGYELHYLYLPTYDTYIYYIESSEQRRYLARIYWTVYDNFLTHLDSEVPIAFVALGSVCIAIKMVYVQKRRKELTRNKRSSTGQTTKTLLAVCVMFIIYKLTYLLYVIFALAGNGDVANIILMNVYYPFVYINSSVNFFIYIALNIKFRNIFLSVIKRKK